ncbi:MAG: ribulose phosphate epimerase [Myxococcota bacterium]
MATLSLACTGDTAPGAEDTAGMVSESADGTTTGGMFGDETQGDTANTPGSTGGGEEDDGSGDAGEGFIMNPDGQGQNNECDVWTQDCPEGEKCMPYANDGSGAWNATRCSEVTDSPDQPGDDCTVEGDGVSGIDSCDIAAMCWDVDGETNIGVCVGFCEGAAENPICSDPGTGCSTSNDGVLILCLPFCDPLLQDCSEGNACYPEAVGFICSPDASGPDLGVYGDPCAFLNACDAGLWCSAAENVPGCSDAACCNAFCDVAEGDTACPDMAGGQMCLPFWAKGESPPGEEDYGVCAIEA